MNATGNQESALARALRTREGDASAVRRVSDGLAKAEFDWIRRARAVRAQAERMGMAIDFPDDPTYPRGLSDLPSSPSVMFRLGAPVSALRWVAIVGSRDADRYGLEVAQRFSEVLASRGIGIVSGGARGIDVAAHQGALDARGVTVAVVAGGLDRLTPASSRRLFAEIIRSDGAILSEDPPGKRPRRMSFPVRNRLVAALSDAVLVIQAEPKSGTSYTVAAAERLGKPVYSVPGDICYAKSQGTNELLSSGRARMAVCPEDVIQALGSMDSREEADSALMWPSPGGRADLLPPSWLSQPDSPMRLILKPVDQEVLTYLNDSPRTASEISVRMSTSLSRVMTSLNRLELAGRVQRISGNRYVSQTR